MTLATLEEYLVDTFTGVLVVVSHDRWFMDRVIGQAETGSLFVFEGEGVVNQFQGSYSEYLVFEEARGRLPSDGAVTAEDPSSSMQIMQSLDIVDSAGSAPGSASSNAATTAPSSGKQKGGARSAKLSYKDQRDYDSLEAQIDDLTSKQEELEAKLAADEAAGKGYSDLAELYDEITQITEDIEAKTERWMELAEKKEQLEHEAEAARAGG